MFKLSNVLKVLNHQRKPDVSGLKTVFTSIGATKGPLILFTLMCESRHFFITSSLFQKQNGPSD